jgi:hypothetical protein
MVPAFSDLLSCEGSENVRLFTYTYPILVKYGLSVKEHRHKIPICANHTFSPIAEYSAWREHHEPKTNSNLPPPREVELLIVFLWLSTAFDNPLPLIVIKANFFTHPPLPEVWPTARTFWELKTHIFQPHIA